VVPVVVDTIRKRSMVMKSQIECTRVCIGNIHTALNAVQCEYSTYLRIVLLHGDQLSIQSRR
jgi:hypothetical protein